MGVVGSLPSPPPPPPQPSPSPSPSSSPVYTVKVKTLCEESISPSDECMYCVMTMNETDNNTNSSSNSNIDDQNQCDNHQAADRSSPMFIEYGPIAIKIRPVKPPTLATGRRSKFLPLEGDAAVKREIRRKRNRDAAKKLKEKRFIIEQQLEKDILQLESEEQTLVSKIKHLETYKEELEIRHNHITMMQERIAKTASSTLKLIQRNRRLIYQNLPVSRKDTHIKEEPRSSSPQWQTFFSI